jgi:peptidoglycan/xylan/chitin deacetylase (PgdA/CDA1 family)
MSRKKIGIVLAVLAILFIASWQLSKSPTYQLVGDLFDRVETSEKLVALTFDDGPTPGFTQTVLGILKEKDVKATFYLVGSDVVKHPIETRSIVEAGHEIGNHTFNHRRMVLMSYGDVRNEVDTTETLIRASGYKGPLTFRPPYGKKFFTLPYYLNQRGITSVTWDVEPESNDAVAASADKVVAHVADKVRPGSIILLHVMYKSRKESMAAVPGVIDALKKKGYTFVTVSELAKRRKK